MSSPKGSPGDWRKSSFSTQDECVEVSFATDVVRVRNTSDRTRPFLSFGDLHWHRFTTAVRLGEFGPTPGQERP